MHRPKGRRRAPQTTAAAPEDAYAVQLHQRQQEMFGGDGTGGDQADGLDVRENAGQPFNYIAFSEMLYGDSKRDGTGRSRAVSHV